jgi:predicted transcriptional regulator
MDTSILEDLGLTQAEIKVYMALLELGSSSAGLILEKAGIQNSVLHRALNSLIEKGLINFILEGKKKVYQATDPGRFYSYIEDKKRRFSQILPELRQKQQLAKEINEASVYRGKKGINEIYNKLIHSGGEEYNTFGGGKRVSFDAMGPNWWRGIHSKLKANNIQARQVFDETIREFGEELSKISGSNIRYLPEEFEQLQETVIIGDYVAINIFTENPYGILIRDKTVVKGYKKYFELLWEKGKN